MLRKMTVAIGRFSVGDSHDYPRGVWNKIALDLMKSSADYRNRAGGDAQKMLNLISTEVDINQSLQSAMRGPINQRQRLGAPQRTPVR